MDKETAKLISTDQKLLHPELAESLSSSSQEVLSGDAGEGRQQDM
jgi:hypothetical protein